FLAIALLAWPANAEQTLVVLRVNGKVVSEEPQILDVDTLSFPASQWVDWGVNIPRALRHKTEVTAQELGVLVEYDSQMMEINVTIPASLRTPRPVGYTRTLPKTVS